MTEQISKEQISKAYVKAVAAYAGIIFRDYEGEDCGLDGRFADSEYDKIHGRIFETGFGIDFQLKATTMLKQGGDNLMYDLEVKNYRDLIKVNVGTPRILIVYFMPPEKNEWLQITENQTVLKKCAWWYSLRGLADTNNTSTVRINIPKTQIFTPDELRRLIELHKEGTDL